MNQENGRRMLAAAGILLLAGVLAYAGGDPWKGKPMDQWTKADVTRILQDSPWAKMISTGGTLALQGNGNLGNDGGSVGTGHGSGGGVLAAEYGDKDPATDPRAAKMYAVVWWSAHTVRAAAAQQSVLAGTETEDLAQKQATANPSDVQIMVHGPNMMVFDKESEQSFMTKAYLQLKSNKQKIMPTKVEYTRTPDGKVSAAIFHFPSTIPAGEKRIDFYCHVGEGNILMSFEPDKMVGITGKVDI